jgi:coenzyme F420-0:L-glutamate ligase
MDQRLATIVLNEADQVLGGVNGFLLTIKNGILTPNAGVDLKNSPSGCVTLWPRKPDRSANRVRGFLNRKFHCRIGVVLVDSRVTPLRLGTTGLAIGVSGFMPVEDYRRQVDLFGRRVHVTRMAVADDLASAAHLLMGESDEGIGLVLIRNAPIVMDMRGSSTRARLGARRCLIASNFRT